MTKKRKSANDLRVGFAVVLLVMIISIFIIAPLFMYVGGYAQAVEVTIACACIERIFTTCCLIRRKNIKMNLRLEDNSFFSDDERNTFNALCDVARSHHDPKYEKVPVEDLDTRVQQYEQKRKKRKKLIMLCGLLFLICCLVEFLWLFVKFIASRNFIAAKILTLLFGISAGNALLCGHIDIKEVERAAIVEEDKCNAEEKV